MAYKIIHLISSLQRGGRERQLANIVASTNQQYTARIVFFNKLEQSYVDEYGLIPYTIHIQSIGRLARLREIHQVIRKEKPDVIHTWGNGEAVCGLLLKPFHQYKLINGSIRHGVRSRKLTHIFRTFILHLSHHIIANSQSGLKANNLRRGRILYNGVDSKFMKPLPDRSLKRMELCGVHEDMPVFISVANLVPYKDYFTVLKALREIKEAGFSFFYLILGDGPMYSEIVRIIHAYGLGRWVRIVGNVEHVADYLKISDVYIHSSKGEGCSNAILEAMACGLPVIASDTGGTSEIVTVDNGLLYDYKDSGQLATHIKQLLNDKEKTRQMSEKSMQMVKSHFTVQAMMEQYYIILSDILRK